jgi:hypothetical protein
MDSYILGNASRRESASDTAYNVCQPLMALAMQAACGTRLGDDKASHAVAYEHDRPLLAFLADR